MRYCFAWNEHVETSMFSCARAARGLFHAAVPAGRMIYWPRERWVSVASSTDNLVLTAREINIAQKPTAKHTPCLYKASRNDV